MFDSFTRMVYRAVYHTARDFMNERRFHRLDGEPMYSGIYPSYEAATLGMPKNNLVGFDQAEALEFYLHHHFDLNQFDYSILYWLNRIYKPGDGLFDFGGGLGQCRYAYDSYFHLSGGSRWVVCELPTFVEKGRIVAAERGMEDLQFTTDLSEAACARIFLSNGALQYLHADMAELLTTLTALPEHVLINRIPATTREAYYTVQRTRHRSYTPYRVVNREAMVAGMRELGYAQLDSWEIQRSLHVNRHPERYVPTYHGFYFRRDS